MPSTALAAAPGLPENRPVTADAATFPEIYGMSVVGACMAPAIPDGCNVKVSKSEPWAHNDIVVVWLKPEFVRTGHLSTMIKRVVMMPPPWVKGFPYRDNPKSDVLALLGLGRDDMPGMMMNLRCSEILAVHRSLGILPPEETGPGRRCRYVDGPLRIEHWPEKIVGRIVGVVKPRWEGRS